MIRVLLVDDSPLILAALREGLIAMGDFEVVGTAADARTAFDLMLTLRPQVLCSALELPGMSGVELTQRVMREAPTPVLLLSDGLVDPQGASTVQARDAGALDVIGKPPHAPGSSIESLGSKLRVLAGVKMFTRRDVISRGAPSRGEASPLLAQPKVVAIGASTGGPQALGRLLKGLDSSFPWPILGVQHMSTGFLAGMVSWLGTQTPLKVKVARHGDRPVAGQVYFAPEDHHLRVAPDGSLAISGGDPVDGHKPSATVLLGSVADVYGKAAIGVLLTGMGADGARGLLEMARVGALTMAQDEESSVVFGMPRQAVEMGAVKHALSLDEIGAQLKALGDRRRK